MDMVHPLHKDFKLAINMIDLERLTEDEVGRKLLSGRLDLQSPILPNQVTIMVSGVQCGDPNETALPFMCELLAAARIVDMVRARDTHNGDSPTRVYIQRKRKGPWERLSGTAALTEKRRGKVRLSTKVFPIEISSMTVPPDTGRQL